MGRSPAAREERGYVDEDAEVIGAMVLWGIKEHKSLLLLVFPLITKEAKFSKHEKKGEGL